mmetsp:Transcript_95122/g.273889  ORF Transcript_95122/g.273889 Transcript_95122/m.273889 type:complete len:246 (+) Transcript_95122:207-944(+)
MDDDPERQADEGRNQVIQCETEVICRLGQLARNWTRVNAEERADVLVAGRPEIPFEQVLLGHNGLDLVVEIMVFLLGPWMHSQPGEPSRDDPPVAKCGVHETDPGVVALQDRRPALLHDRRYPLPREALRQREEERMPWKRVCAGDHRGEGHELEERLRPELFQGVPPLRESPPIQHHNLGPRAHLIDPPEQALEPVEAQGAHAASRDGIGKILARRVRQDIPVQRPRIQEVWVGRETHIRVPIP